MNANREWKLDTIRSFYWEKMDDDILVENNIIGASNVS